MSRSGEVLYFEKAGPWGSRVQPRALTLKHLKMQLRARGVEPRGCKRELVQELERILNEEMLQSWQERTENLTAIHQRLKDLVARSVKEDPTFNLGQVNQWIQEEVEQGTWDWANHPKSLSLKQREHRRRFEIEARKKQRVEFLQHALFTEVTSRNCRTMRVKAASVSASVSGQQTFQPPREDLANISDTRRCTWKSTVDGVSYHCVNRRQGKDATESNVCPYHAHFCTRDHADVKGASTVIKRPNPDGLCLYCYLKQYSCHPPSVNKHECPGVHVFNAGRMEKLLEVQEAVEAIVKRSASSTVGDNEKLSSVEQEKLPVCQWRLKSNGEWLHCTNHVMTHLTTGAVLKKCAYHAKKCTLQHEAGLDDITIPNELGMCLVHYKQQLNSVPDTSGWVTLTHQEETFPPGVTLRNPKAQAGRPHPLRPISVAFLPRTNSSVSNIQRRRKTGVGKYLSAALGGQGTNSRGQGRFIKWTSTKLEKMDWARKGRAALLIQRAVRGWAGRRLARAKQQLHLMKVRGTAATLIQAQVRGCLVRGQTKAHREQVLRSVLLVQNKYRRFAASKVLRRLRAVVVIQRYSRGMLDRLNFAAVRVLQRVEEEHSDVIWANHVITIYMIAFIHRWRVRKRKKRLKTNLPHIVTVQSLVRRFLVRFRGFRPEVSPSRKQQAAILLQAFMRRFLTKETLEESNLSHETAARIQATWRGFRARIVLLLKREAMKGFRSWLTSVNAKDGYAMLLPKELYECEPGRAKILQEKKPRREFDEMYGERPVWTLAMFEPVDPDGIGLIRRYEFQQVLRGMTYPIAESQIRQLTAHWALPNGLVFYPPFVRFARKQLKPCNKHRVWTCCTCVSYGKCDKCLCKRFIPSVSSPERRVSAKSICVCGHYFMVHEITPYAAHVKDQTDDRRITQQELNAMLTREIEPDFTPNVQGVTIPRMSKFHGQRRATTPSTLEAIVRAKADDEALSYILLPQQKEKRKKGRSLTRSLLQGAVRPYTASVFTHSTKSQKNGLSVSVGNELVLDVDNPELYIDTLLALSNPAVSLIEDSQAFVGFVFKALAFLQLHWKQLIYDIRTGCLSHSISISLAARQAIERQLTPNPGRAQKVENALKALGFNSIGKPKDNYLEEVNAVQPVNMIFRRQVPPARKRRVSLPALPVVQSSLEPKPVDKLERFDPESEERSEGDEHETLLNILTAPRFQPDPVQVAVGRKARPFICTFPGCSRSFTHPMSAEAHFIRAHKSCARLAVRKVTVDEAMHRYWPKQCPWTNKTANPTLREVELYEEAAAMSLPYKCDRLNCERRFAKRKELRAHIQYVHSRPEKLLALIGPMHSTRSTMHGSICHVPPASLPVPLQLPVCKKHWLTYRPNCRACEGYITMGLPIAPMQCFEMVKLYISGANDILGSSNQALEGCLPQMQRMIKSLLSDEDRMETLRTKGISAVILLRKERSPPDICFGRIVGLLNDKTGRSFIAYHELVASHGLNLLLQSFGSPAFASLKGEIDDDNELIEHIKLEYIQLHSVIGSFYVLPCSGEEFVQRLKDKDLPNNPYGRSVPFFSCKQFDGMKLETILT